MMTRPNRFLRRQQREPSLAGEASGSQQPLQAADRREDDGPHQRTSDKSSCSSRVSQTVSSSPPSIQTGIQIPETTSSLIALMTTLSRTRSVSENSSFACKSLAGAPTVTNVTASETGMWRAYHTPQPDADAMADFEAREALEQTTGLQLETHAAALNGSEAQSRGTVQVSSSSGQQLSLT